MTAPERRIDWARVILAQIALLLVASALVQPLWRSALSAPQYPDGLDLIVFGDRAEGDLAEIDSLNHYIGMRPLRLEELPELVLWIPGLAAAAVAVVVGLFGRGLVSRLARIFLWMVPISILAVIQFRLHQFGHDLDPGAAFRMDGFTPWVIGPTRVWNFTAWSRPGTGVLALAAAAATATFGPSLLCRIRKVTPAAMTIALVVLSMVAALPAAAQSGQDHSGDHVTQSPAATPTPSEGSHARPSTVAVDMARLIELQPLIDSVPDGGTLTLPAAAYRGGVVIDQALTIEGVGMPIIVGDGSGTVVTVTAPGATLRGIHVTGSGNGPGGQPAGIRVAADGVELDDVVVGDSYIGIAVDNVAKVRILDSLVLGRSNVGIGGEGHAVDGSHDGHESGGRGDGISIWDSEAVLVRGTLIQDVRDGIYASFGSSILIDGNTVTGSRYAVHTMFSKGLVVIENRFEHNLSGVVLMYGGPADVVRNGIRANISPATGFGLLLKDVADARVVQNTILDNKVGLHLDGPAGGAEPIQITANTVAENQFGVMIYPSASATFMANSFVDNLVQVAQQGRGSAGDIAWADRGWGNFWSTYQGFDDGQGKGVVPHAEASSVNRVLVRSPILAPLATSPAMRLVEALEGRWLRRSPVAVDELPLTRPVSPRLAQRVPDPGAVSATSIAGLVLAAMGLGVLVRSSRRPRHSLGGS